MYFGSQAQYAPENMADRPFLQNQMQEALMLFESISNSQWFIRTALILFLNKMDLFKAKLKVQPIPKYFPDYTGDPTDTKTASKFFQAKFKGLNRNPNKVSLRSFWVTSLGM
jgi:hypothetical protein